MRNDPLTDEMFEPKRINQRFANAKNRIIYHNNQANKLRHRLSYINKPLINNLKILDALMENKKSATFHKQYLLGMGYHFEVTTHLEEYEGVNHFAIYNYILLVCENDKIRVVRYD
jgi:hypothetical protein